MMQLEMCNFRLAARFAQPSLMRKQQSWASTFVLLRLILHIYLLFYFPAVRLISLIRTFCKATQLSDCHIKDIVNCFLLRYLRNSVQVCISVSVFGWYSTD